MSTRGVIPFVNEMIETYLEERGFDGLYNTALECGCVVGDLQPCGGANEDCRAGMKASCQPDQKSPRLCNGCGIEIQQEEQWHVTSRADEMPDTTAEDRIRMAIRKGVEAGDSLRSLRDEFERLVIRETLKRNRNLVSTARALGITRECLYEKRKKYGLELRRNVAREIPDDWRDRLKS